jgi:hypothetical protein
MSDKARFDMRRKKPTVDSVRASREESNGVGAADTTAWETTAARIAKDAVNFMVIKSRAIVNESLGGKRC